MTKRHGAAVVFTGAPGDRALIGSVQSSMEVPSFSLVGKSDVELLAGIIACADVVVTGDSAPVHLASAVGAPVVAIYGPTNPITYGPRGTLNRTISAGLPCGPCYNLLATAECPWNMKPAPCMRAVGVVGVERAIVEILTTAKAIR